MRYLNWAPKLKIIIINLTTETYKMMMKDNQSRVNKKNEDSQELERLKDQIKNMTSKDYEFTD